MLNYNQEVFENGFVWRSSFDPGGLSRRAFVDALFAYPEDVHFRMLLKLS
jgi:hypothetical protein